MELPATLFHSLVDECLLITALPVIVHHRVYQQHLCIFGAVGYLFFGNAPVVACRLQVKLQIERICETEFEVLLILLARHIHTHGSPQAVYQSAMRHKSLTHHDGFQSCHLIVISRRIAHHHLFLQSFLFPAVQHKPLIGLVEQPLAHLFEHPQRGILGTEQQQHHPMAGKQEELAPLLCRQAFGVDTGIAACQLLQDIGFGFMQTGIVRHKLCQSAAPVIEHLSMHSSILLALLAEVLLYQLTQMGISIQSFKTSRCHSRRNLPAVLHIIVVCRGKSHTGSGYKQAALVNLVFVDPHLYILCFCNHLLPQTFAVKTAVASYLPEGHSGNHEVSTDIDAIGIEIRFG